MILDLIAGARPNFVKLAPVVRALAAFDAIDVRIVHTGQHYDAGMDAVFFQELGIPPPDVHLGAGSGTHGAQTARILERYEARLLEDRPRATVVFGDVNSTIACALAGAKLHVPIVHVEAGLRSFDRTMPEEVNRVLTDVLSDLLFVTEPAGVENLAREGIAGDRVRLVGNVMIDTLLGELDAARASGAPARHGVEPRGFGLVTLHRPSNVDDPQVLQRLLRALGEQAARLPLLFTVHPRTRAAAARAGLESLLAQPGLRALEPLPYRELLALMDSARVVITDSGGMQEETTCLGVPCITLRDTTERPLTVERGTSRLVGNDVGRFGQAMDDVLAGRWPAGERYELWDGRAAVRVAEQLVAWLSG